MHTIYGVEQRIKHTIYHLEIIFTNIPIYGDILCNNALIQLGLIITRVFTKAVCNPDTSIF